jgi:hypothetical protein
MPAGIEATAPEADQTPIASDHVAALPAVDATVRAVVAETVVWAMKPVWTVSLLSRYVDCKTAGGGGAACGRGTGQSDGKRRCVGERAGSGGDRRAGSGGLNGRGVEAAEAGNLVNRHVAENRGEAPGRRHGDGERRAASRRRAVVDRYGDVVGGPGALILALGVGVAFVIDASEAGRLRATGPKQDGDDRIARRDAAGERCIGVLRASVAANGIDRLDERDRHQAPPTQGPPAAQAGAVLWRRARIARIRTQNSSMTSE